MSHARYFPSHDVPTEVDALVASGRLADLSFHRDDAPHFVLSRDRDTTDLTSVPVLWVQHPDIARRLSDERFLVCQFDQTFATNDINDALRELLSHE